MNECQLRGTPMLNLQTVVLVDKRQWTSSATVPSCRLVTFHGTVHRGFQLLKTTTTQYLATLVQPLIASQGFSERAALLK
jgi:hypothetical protein